MQTAGSMNVIKSCAELISTIINEKERLQLSLQVEHSLSCWFFAFFPNLRFWQQKGKLKFNFSSAQLRKATKARLFII